MTLDSMTRSLAYRLGNSYSRRSFIGRVGAALTVAGAGSLGLRVADAEGDILGCGCPNCGHSSECTALPPYCPTDACHCGSWYKCECGSFLKRYMDCCSACPNPYCGDDGWPRCYYSPPYSGGCNGNTKVKCRNVFCTNFSC